MRGRVSARPLRMDHLSLDELAEVRRIPDIVRDVRARNLPRFYSAMREREVKAAAKIFSGFAEELRNGRPVGGMIPEWATGVTTEDFSTRTLESKYDFYQAELIDAARITRIVEAGVESDLEDISDGPIGQVPK